jgi:hypothetical protein
VLAGWLWPKFTAWPLPCAGLAVARALEKGREREWLFPE